MEEAPRSNRGWGPSFCTLEVIYSRLEEVGKVEKKIWCGYGQSRTVVLGRAHGSPAKPQVLADAPPLTVMLYRHLQYLSSLAMQLDLFS
jgi:hypothetical protein